VLEVARTFGGAPHRLADHAAALVARAASAGLAVEHTVADVVAAAEASVGPSAALLEPGDDVVIAIALTGAPHAAFLDTADAPPAAELLVTCRLLSQPAGALRALAADWPLQATPAGLVDRLGGEVGAVSGGALVLRPGAGGVACDVARVAAADAGLEVAEGAPRAEGADELLVLGLPFCFVALTGDDGALVRALGRRWERETGVDVAAQLRALTA
jgi:hypothetical protein